MIETVSLSKAIGNLEKIAEVDLQNDFVAIGSYLDDSRSSNHSVLIICFNEELKIFHYSGKDVELIAADMSHEIYLKRIDIIDPSEVVAFLGFCEELNTIGVHPNYGFIFNHSFYNISDKKSFLIDAKHDITTCSGFCIKVIRGFLYNNPEYLHLQDWTFASYESAPENLKGYMFKVLSDYAAQNKISIDELFTLNEIKRVTPLELLIAGNFTNLAIRKLSIDSIILGISEFIREVA